jgi:hypothetical protein
MARQNLPPRGSFAAAGALARRPDSEIYPTKSIY